MGKVIEIFGALTTFAGLALFGVSMGTTQWFSTIFANYGLFKVCARHVHVYGDICTDPGFDVTDASIFFPKVFMIGAAGFLGLGLLFHLISFCAETKTKGCCLIAGATFYILGAIVTACAPAILLGLNQTSGDTNFISNLFSITTKVINGSTYGYSFYLAWAAAALIFISSIIDCVAGCTTSDDRVAPQQGVVWSAGESQTTFLLTDSATQQGAATGQTNYYLPA